MNKIPSRLPRGRSRLRWLGAPIVTAAVLFLAIRTDRGARPADGRASIQLKLDTSSDEAFRRSLDIMTASLSDTRKRQFAEALVELAGGLVGRKSTLSASLRSLHGKTVDELIEQAGR